MEAIPSSYIPPDPTCIELNRPEAVEFWSRTLEIAPERLREAAQKAGPLVEDVKKELGIAGAG
jgi:hypothetical protein